MMKYRGFLSYSHFDSKLVARLHRQLESLQFAASKGARATNICSPIFRDRKDLGDTPHLREGIVAALRNSECLIIACTSHARTSEYVATEISEFLALHPNGEILAALLEGDGAAEQPQNLPQSLPNGANVRVFDLRSNGEGLYNGSLQLAAYVSGIEFSQLREFNRRRRVRNLTIASTGFTLGLSMLGLSLFATAYIVGNTYNSALFTFSGISIVNDQTNKMINLDQYPGPSERVSLNALDHTSQSVELLAESPGIRFLPGAKVYIDNYRWGIARERFRIYNLSGRTGEALVAAKAEVVRLHDVQDHLTPWAAFIIERQVHSAVTIPLVLGRAEAQTYLDLSLAESSCGQYQQALIDAKLAQRAIQKVLLRPDSNYEDRTKSLDIDAAVASISSAMAPDAIGRRAALDRFINAAEALPNKGTCCGGSNSWANVRASYIALARASALSVESAKHDSLQIVASFPAASQAVDDLSRTQAGTPGYLSYLKMVLIQSYVTAAETPADRALAAKYIQDALPNTMNVVAQEIYAPFSDEALSSILMSDALAKAQAGDPSYVQRIQQSLLAARTMIEKDPYNFRTRYLLAVRLSEAAYVMKVKRRCNVSDRYAKMAVDNLKVLQAEEPMSQAIRDEIRETNLYSTCH